MSQGIDDEITGRALQRAIETQEIPETPFERSRIALPAPRDPGWIRRPLAIAAVLVIVLGLATWAVASREYDAAASPRPALASPPTLTRPPSAGTAVDHNVMYVARIGLPPVAFRVQMPAAATTPELRIASRLTDLRALRPDAAPPGARNFLWNNTFQGGVTVGISGELATIDLLLQNKPWDITEDAAAMGILQQLVYTATEEPGIRAVLFTHDGGQRMRIGDIVLDQPLMRENVFGYTRVSPQLIGEEFVQPCSPGPCPSAPIRLSSSYLVESAELGVGVTRFTISVDSGQPSRFTIEPTPLDDAKTDWGGKYVLRIDIAGTDANPGLAVVDRTPLRAVRTTVVSGQTTYQLALDDLRPWRVSTLRDPYRIVIDMGGYASSISGSIAVYRPVPGTPPGRQISVDGFSSAPQGMLQWRVRDASQRVVANGTAAVSEHAGHQWSPFAFLIQLPASASGDLWLEVYWLLSPDAEQGLVRVPLKVG